MVGRASNPATGIYKPGKFTANRELDVVGSMDKLRLKHTLMATAQMPDINPFSGISVIKNEDINLLEQNDWEKVLEPC
ncbi:hypothetical protein GV64_05340 [Endozoicomonas elysicola]|uniref:Uncharacterized protein n=1 Tax=Endozoicomonas elysicola TaxID=305900 RepID=A0A081K7W3_9GAMM|nr:hypothetical protein GV64_05340 [Endozoicomonas elysicola]